MTATPRVLALLEPVVSGAGYDLEDLTVSAAGKRSVVRVLVDKDGGVTLDDVADVSRVVSDALDAADEQDPTLLGASYVLEVSSPGVDRPLTQPRHWRRNVGRLVAASLRDGSTAEGRITAADDAGVTLDDERVLSWADVARGLVQVEFNRKDEPDEPDDSDEEDDAPAETAAEVAARIEAALEFIEPERLQVAPDCGMKYLPRDVAFAKLRALVEGAEQVRARLD